jgi:predicted GH43/DUF377 family glycosyl hydrolase
MNAKAMCQTCFIHAGLLVHNNKLIIPYGLSDYSTSFAEVEVDALIDRLLSDGA